MTAPPQSRTRCHVYNRTRGKGGNAGERKARKVADPAFPRCRGEAVFTMLSDDAAVEAVVFGDGGLLANLKKNAIHISSSTISVALSKRLAADHAHEPSATSPRLFLAGPKLQPQPNSSSSRRASRMRYRTVAPLFDAVSQKTFTVSETAEAANLVKLGGNFLIASVIKSLGEAMALVGKGGVDKNQYLDVMTSTLSEPPSTRPTASSSRTRNSSRRDLLLRSA